MISSINTSYDSLCRLFDFSNGKISSNKKLLLSLARRGRPKPSYKTSLYAYLCSCTNKSNCLYDDVFSESIRNIRPDWFVRRQEITRKKKENLIKIAKKMMPRPNHSEASYRDLFSYTNKNSKAYDKDFDTLIRKLRPDWFYTRTRLSQIKKQNILKLAKERKPKPSRNHVLGIAIKNYTNKSSQAYDSNFEAEIKKLRPDWFKNSAK
jgi:hypothetical protein